MANKIIAILLGLMFLITLTPMVLAEDTNIKEEINLNEILDSNITPIDEREIRSILSPYGAEVRMLQLEKAVTRNILIGNLILQVIETNHLDANTTEAENILNKMEMLLEEIQLSPIEGDKNVLVQNFVEFKKEAKTLISMFRKETQELITQNDKRQIMQQVREIDKEQLTQFNERIKEKVRIFNSNRLNEKFNSIGLKMEELIGKIRNGDANLSEIKKSTNQKINDLNVMEKKRLISKIKNNSIKKIVEQKEITQRISKNLKEKLMNNIQKREADLNKWLELKMINTNEIDINRSQRLTNQKDRISELIQKTKSRNGGNQQ
jgi:hypothetical protein